MTAGSGDATSVRIGEAAEMLGVSVETLRRWATDGRIATTRSDGRQRLVPLPEVTRILRERRVNDFPEGGSRTRSTSRSGGTSARNRFPGVITRVERDRVAAVVEIQAGPHRLVSLMTAEAVDELGLSVGDAVVGVVKATNVVVELAHGKDRS